MKKAFRAVFVGCLLTSWPAVTAAGGPSAADTSNPHVLLSSIERELKRAHADMAKLDPAPYFLSYSVHDQSSGAAVGILGDLVSSVQGQRRTADVITRIGSPALDNSHQENRRSAIHSGVLSLEDDADSISRELWLLTFRGYREAAHAFVNVKTKTQVKAQEEDTSPDFSQESPVTYGENEPLPSLPNGGYF
jgi:TldD protein